MGIVLVWGPRWAAPARVCGAVGHALGAWFVRRGVCVRCARMGASAVATLASPRRGSFGRAAGGGRPRVIGTSERFGRSSKLPRLTTRRFNQLPTSRTMSGKCSAFFFRQGWDGIARAREREGGRAT